MGAKYLYCLNIETVVALTFGRERATSLRGEHQWLKMKLRVGTPTIFLQFLTNHYFSSLLEHPLFSVNLAVFDWGLRFPISDSRKIDNLNAINDAGDDEI